MQQFRDNGAIGAILDEYEKALKELNSYIKPLLNEEITAIVDIKTKDEDCRSIQTILTHVVSSGFNYAIEIRNWLGEEVAYTKPELLPSASAYILALNAMFGYNEQLFKDYPSIKLVEKDSSKKIFVRWGQRYDVDQLFEHAIVHILRHRRKIERFIITLKS